VGVGGAYRFEGGVVLAKDGLGHVFGEIVGDGKVAVGVAGLHGPVGLEECALLVGEAVDGDGVEAVDGAGDGFEAIGDGVGVCIRDRVWEDVDVHVALAKISAGDGGFGVAEGIVAGWVAGVKFGIAGKVGCGVDGARRPGDGRLGRT
jgi:hypothetical protein